MVKKLQNLDDRKIPVSISIKRKDFDIISQNDYSLTSLMNVLIERTKKGELNCNIKDVWVEATNGRFNPSAFQ